MTLTEKEMLIAEMCTLSGAVLSGILSEKEAIGRIKKSAKKHGFSLNQALILQNEIDDMLKDSSGV